MNRNSDFLATIIPIFFIVLMVYGIVRIFANITYGILYEDLVKETVEEVVNQKCVLK